MNKPMIGNTILNIGDEVICPDASIGVVTHYFESASAPTGWYIEVKGKLPSTYFGIMDLNNFRLAK